MPLEQALVPMSLFKITNYSAVVVTASVGTMIYFSMNILWPLQIGALYTTDNIQIGWLSVSETLPAALFYFSAKGSKAQSFYFVITNTLPLN
jgi:hypothetical protein